MLRLLSFSLLPLLIAGQEFQCGTDKIQADIAKTVVQFNCKDKVADINGCCIGHDACYDKQESRVNCDAAFCTCVAAASAGNPLCGFYTSIFCDTAKVFGEAAYKKVGEERKVRERREEAERAKTSTTVPPTTVPSTTVPPKVADAPAPTPDSTASWLKHTKAVKAAKDDAAHAAFWAKHPKRSTTTAVPETTAVPQTTAVPVTVPAPALDVLAGFKTATKQEIKIVPEAEPKPEAKKGGESRHKEDKLPGDKTKVLRKSDPESAPATTATVPEQTSSEEDREVADLEARLAREEAKLEREEAVQRRVLEQLAERKAALRADLQRFRETQRALWRAKKDEEDTVAKEGTVAAQEDSTLTPSTTTVVVVEAPTTTTTVAPPTTTVAPTTTTDASLDPQRKREALRARRRLEARARHEEIKKKIEEHRARVLAAQTLRLAATSTTTTTTVEPETVQEPKVTVTSDLLEGSGQQESATKAGPAWTDDDLIPEAE